MSADENIPENEIVATARAAKRHLDSAAGKPEPGRSNRWNATTIGLGVGIGSAAVAAALLYANRSKTPR